MTRKVESAPARFTFGLAAIFVAFDSPRIFEVLKAAVDPLAAALARMSEEDVSADFNV